MNHRERIRRQRKPLIDPKAIALEKEAKWMKILPTFQTELAEIRTGKHLPVSARTRSMEDKDPDLLMIQMSCTDDEREDRDEKRLVRKKGKARR